jgi:hypothetical protein
VDISHWVVWFAVDLVKPVFGWVKALYAGVRCSILDCNLSFQSRAVQGAHNSINTFKVLCEIGPSRIFGVEGFDDYIALLCKMCAWWDEGENLELVAWSRGRC